MRDLVFFTLAAVLLGSAFAVVAAKSLFRAVFALAAALLATAGLYLLLTAPLVAAVQILLYTGGVLTLSVFALVVAGGNVEAVRWRSPWPAGAVAAGAFAALAAAARTMQPLGRPGGLDNGTDIGVLLFRDYLVPFELLSVLLLGAICGALLLARKDRPE